MKIPLLPFRNPEGIMTNPLGSLSFSGWYFYFYFYFTEELKQAERYGYTITVTHGYTFDRGVDIFKDFVNDGYKNKLVCNDDPIKRTLEKLKLNSLYGRFGIIPTNETCNIVDSDSQLFNEISLKHDVMDFIRLDSKLIFVRYRSQFNTELTKLTQVSPMLSDNTSFITSSIELAAATAAYARIHMNELLINNQDHVYYTDTDSLVLDKPLPNKLVGSKIGLMKLEHAKIPLGLFASPKMYYLKLLGGTVVKAKSITNPSLNERDFIDLIHGKTITVQNQKWITDMANSTVRPVTSEMNLNSLSINNRIKL